MYSIIRYQRNLNIEVYSFALKQHWVPAVHLHQVQLVRPGCEGGAGQGEHEAGVQSLTALSAISYIWIF